MADFRTPFADEGERRNPTPTERTLGFPAGPADQLLFNGLHHTLQSEIGEVISHAGITGSDEDLTQLRQAIEALIAAATGGGDTSAYILMSQARARLPFFPEIVSADHKINVTSPASGTIRVPAGVTFMHRGIYPEVTVETDFTTLASKVYHVRWIHGTGYVMRDLADLSYNPSSFAETDPTFDTAYDDMLIARVTTNSSNVPTITNLANAAQLTFEDVTASLSPTNFQNNTSPDALTLDGETFDLNWSRKPLAHLRGFTDVTVFASSDVSAAEMNLAVQSLSRYQVRAIYQRTRFAGGAQIAVSARA